jgi:hypothetical protein
MKPAPTLFDQIYRATFNYSAKRRGISFVDHPDRLRQHLRDARKFVLDDKMSSFLVDLSSAAFLDKKRPSKFTYRLVDQMRVLARLPHKLTWVEYNFAIAQQRAHEFGLMSPFDNPADIKARTGCQGWLLNQHPANETLFRIHIFESVPLWGGLLTPPFAFAWQTDDAPSAWSQPSLDKTIASQSEMCVGVVGYRNDRCGIVKPEYCDDPEPHNDQQAEVYREFLRLHSSALRRVWALLATVNDIPVEARSVIQSKGFVARGQYHRFLDHKIITLRVPDKADLKKLARDVVAISRRRAHQVRGHWRKDHWRPGERIWVHEHQRGDASLGFVMHDYVVEHRDDNVEIQSRG